MLRILKEIWDKEYIKGRWEYLNTPIERARQAVIGMYCNQILAGKAKILDAGCGVGVLFDYLKPSLQKNYLGMDLSKEAIKRARFRRKGNFLVADIEKFETQDKFDAIVFSEVLYSVDEVKVFERYSRFLKKGGYFIVSLYQHKFDGPIWENIRKFYQLVGWIEITGVSQGKKITWRVEVGRSLRSILPVKA